MRLYLSSQDSKDIYPENTPSNFRVELPQHLNRGSCTVLQCVLPFRPSVPVYLACDLIEPSILGGRYQSVLTALASKTREFSNPDYTKVKVASVSTIQLKLINRRGEVIPVEKGETVVVLDLLP